MFQKNSAFAKKMDAKDPLKNFRKEFFIPKVNQKEAIYLCGNSLGLQPKSVSKFIKQELEDWANLGVEGHLHAKRPWLSYHKNCTNSLAKLVGSKPAEIVAMNQLTVNLNMLLISFYNPVGKKKKILMQANEFPSDYYAVEQQIRQRGLDPAECILEVLPRNGETTLRTEDILTTIEKHKDELALILFSAVNYYTGQFFELPKIAKTAKKHNIYFGVDCAHGIGNVPLELHQWGVDFATWCSYKYLNSGPGGVSGIYVHETHCKNTSLHKLGGWWGNAEKTRFKMQKHYEPVSSAESWQNSNAPILSMAAHLASLEIYDKTSMKELREKSLQLVAYLDFLLAEIPSITNITPAAQNERGCQVSLRMKNGKKVFDKITQAGVIADWREPDVIRIAAVPLYNSFSDIFHFVKILKESLV